MCVPETFSTKVPEENKWGRIEFHNRNFILLSDGFVIAFN